MLRAGGRGDEDGDRPAPPIAGERGSSRWPKRRGRRAVRVSASMRILPRPRGRPPAATLAGTASHSLHCHLMMMGRRATPTKGAPKPPQPCRPYAIGCGITMARWAARSKTISEGRKGRPQVALEPEGEVLAVPFVGLPRAWPVPAGRTASGAGRGSRGGPPSAAAGQSRALEHGVRAWAELRGSRLTIPHPYPSGRRGRGTRHAEGAEIG